VPDLFWYGIHCIEMLYTLMGPGCESVSRAYTTDTDVLVGRWKDGRIGVVRGNRQGPHTYGAVAYGSNTILSFGAPRPEAPKEPREGNAYPALLRAAVEFFRTGKAPVTPEETLEIFAFMEAADLSKARRGAPGASCRRPSPPPARAEHLPQQRCDTGSGVAVSKWYGGRMWMAYGLLPSFLGAAQLVHAPARLLHRGWKTPR
jgi:hypothetical protein